MNCKILWVLVAATALTGCAASGQKYSEMKANQVALAAGNARLIVIRPSGHFQNAIRSTRVKIDDVEVGDCDNGGFNSFDVAAGKHAVTVDLRGSPGQCVLPIEVTANSTNFYEVHPREGQMFAMMGAGIIGAALESSGQVCGGGFSIVAVEQNTALSKMDELRATK